MKPIIKCLVLLLLVNGMATVAVQAQALNTGELEARRERDLARQRLLSVLDAVFGVKGYHAEISQSEAGAQVLLVVDQHYSGEYAEPELRKLVAATLGVDLSRAGAFVLSPLPLSESDSLARTRGGANLSPVLLLFLGALLFVLGAISFWYFGPNKRDRSYYRDQLETDLDNFRRLAVEDAARVAQVLRMWMRPAASASAESGGMTQRELAAVLLLSLPKESAAAVIQHFLPKEIQILGDIMVRIARVRRTVLRYAVVQFYNDVQEATGFGVRSEWDMHGLFESALGEKRSRLLSGFSDLQSNAPLLENLRWLDVDAVVDLINGEHPQLQAIVVASLELEKATQVLERLAEGSRADVLMRVAELDKLQPTAVEAVSELIEKKLASPSRTTSAGRPGQRQAAAILKSVSADWAESLMQDIYRRDQSLAALLQDQMFTMDDLLALTSADWHKVQQQLPDDLLARALLSCKPDTREGFLQRLPKARAKAVRPLLRQFAGVGADLIQQSASDVLSLVRRMAAAGDIVVGGELRLADPASVN